MKTVSINLKEDKIYSSQEVPINYILKLDSSFVDMANYLNEDELGVLIQFEHNQTTAILNLTNVSPYVLLFFDDKFNFKGASYSIKSGTGSFTINTQYKNILFVRMPHNLKLNNINNLSHESIGNYNNRIKRSELEEILIHQEATENADGKWD